MSHPPLKTRYLLPALGGLALVGLGTIAMAKPPTEAAGARGDRGGVCARLSCTDAQREEMRAIGAELREDTRGDREAIARLRKTLATELAKDTPDEAAMKATLAQIARHEQEIRDRAFDAVMEVHGLLDAEQRAKLVKAMEHRGLRGLMGGGPGKRGEGKRGEGKRAR